MTFTPCAFQPCDQDGSIHMRSEQIKQARLTRQVPGWSSDHKIVNVCETHAALVDRDRSCCVDQCPIVVSEFSLPTILHRPLPFRLKEGTPHRYLCLGHNLRYIDTLRKPMAASAVADVINNNNANKRGESKARKAKTKAKEEFRTKLGDSEEEEEEEASEESNKEEDVGSNQGEDDKENGDKEDEDKSEEDTEMGEADDKKQKRKKKADSEDDSDKAYEMEVDTVKTEKSEKGEKIEEARRSQRVKRARQLAEEEDVAAKQRQQQALNNQDESQQEVWTFEHDSIPSLTLSAVPTTPTKSPSASSHLAKLRPRNTAKKLVVATSPPLSSSSPVPSPTNPNPHSPSMPFTPPDSSGTSPVESPTSPPHSPDSNVPPKDRRCWFPNCFKADRTLRTLRPAQISTCKSHLLKQESLLRSAIVNNKIVLIEGDGKDQVCAICIDYYTTPDHWVCSNDSCSFIFCKKCVDFITRRRSTPKKERWICWSCEASAAKNKPKERTHFMGLLTQQSASKSVGPNNNTRVLRNSSSSITAESNPDSAPPSPSSTPSTPSSSSKRPSSPLPELLDPTSKLLSPSPSASIPPTTTTTTHTNSQSTPLLESTRPTREKRKQPVNLPSLETNTVETSILPLSPPSPPPTISDLPPGTTTQSAMIQYLLSTTLASLRRFASDNPREDAQRIQSLFECTRQLKSIHADLPFPEYSTIWDHLREIAGLLANELEASISLHTMTEDPSLASAPDKEDLVHNPELETDISKMQDFQDIGEQLKFKYKEVSWRLKEILEHVSVQEEAKLKDIEKVMHRKSTINDLASKEIASLEEELNGNTREEEELRVKEKVLLDQLREVRAQLARNDTGRRALQKWLQEMRQRHEESFEEIMQLERRAIRNHDSVLAQNRSMLLLSQLVDGMYWLHTKQFDPQLQLNDHYIASKMRTLERGYRRSIGTAFANQQQEDDSDTQTKPGTLMIYHKVCLSHEVPRDHLEKPDRLRAAISVIHELHALYPESLAIFTNPPEVEQRYLYLVHDPRYVNKLRSLIPTSNPTNSTPTATSPTPSSPQTLESTPPVLHHHSKQLLHIDYLLDLHSEADAKERSRSDTNAQNGSESPSSEEEEERDPNLYDTFVSPLSLQAAFRASGAVCEAVDAVMRGGYTRAFCAVRPPGHHVGRMGRTKNVPSQGFCLLNNVAIGAKYALFTTGLERIAIVDFDVHHGNGTQEVLEGDSNFMFFSIHVHDPKKFFYPGTGGECPPLSDCGSCDSATGLESFENVVNVPLKRNTASGTFLTAFSQRIIQGLLKFSPQLILLSAGFDGHRDDPTNGLRLGEEDYHTITKMLKRVARKCCQGRIVSVLEGGYALEGRNSAFRRSVAAHLRALVRDDDEDDEDGNHHDTVPPMSTTRITRQQTFPKKGSIQSLLVP